jgi:hypothetical protein
MNVKYKTYCNKVIMEVLRLFSRGLCIATFHIVINRVEQDHCSREKWLSTQSIAHRLIDPWVHTQFLSQANQ